MPHQFSGLNSLTILKTTNCTKGKESVRLALATMRDASANSDWNFTNKLLLLEAEQHTASQGDFFTYTPRHQILALYDASIAAAKKSGFIHEQGLACEKAGFYCKETRDVHRALVYFKQARECYEEWGSSMKVDLIQKELNGLNGH